MSNSVNPPLAQGVERFNKERDALMKWVDSISHDSYKKDVRVELDILNRRSSNALRLSVRDENNTRDYVSIRAEYDKDDRRIMYYRGGILQSDDHIADMMAYVIRFACVELPPFEYED